MSTFGDKLRGALNLPPEEKVTLPPEPTKAERRTALKPNL